MSHKICKMNKIQSVTIGDAKVHTPANIGLNFKGNLPTKNGEPILGFTDRIFFVDETIAVISTGEVFAIAATQILSGDRLFVDTNGHVNNNPLPEYFTCGIARENANMGDLLLVQISAAANFKGTAGGSGGDYYNFVFNNTGSDILQYKAVKVTGHNTLYNIPTIDNTNSLLDDYIIGITHEIIINNTRNTILSVGLLKVVNFDTTSSNVLDKVYIEDNGVLTLEYTSKPVGVVLNKSIDPFIFFDFVSLYDENLKHETLITVTNNIDPYTSISLIASGSLWTMSGKNGYLGKSSQVMKDSLNIKIYRNGILLLKGTEVLYVDKNNIEFPITLMKDEQLLIYS